jgi:hypothetical protein
LAFFVFTKKYDIFTRITIRSTIQICAQKRWLNWILTGQV